MIATMRDNARWFLSVPTTTTACGPVNAALVAAFIRAEADRLRRQEPLEVEFA